MKKIFIAIFSILVLPFVVSAEEKVFGDVKYIIEEKDAKEYVCEEIKDHDLEILPHYQLELYVNDITDNKIYLVDITKPGVCKPFEPKTISRILTVEWGDNNSIYEVEYNSEVGFTYLYDSSLGRVAAFELPHGQYDPTADYYIDDNGEAKLVEEPDKNQTDFDAGVYLTKLEPTRRRLIGQMDPNILVAPKEKTGLSNDLTFDKDGLLGFINFNGKTYYVFHNFNHNNYVSIFDEEGNYQTFGHEKILVSNFSTSIDDEYIILMYDQDQKKIMEVLDTKYNLVLSKKLDDYTIHFIGKNENTNYIFDHDQMNNESKIISITKKTVEMEKVPNTYDGVTTSIVVGVIALLGLAVTIILYKKKVN